MNEQIRATAMTAGPAAERGAATTSLDAWDRLAALAFGDVASAGGCSEHAHDCTCLAENASERPVYPDAEPEPMPLWTPEPEEEPEIAG